MITLRGQIIEDQKARFDLQKWKLIIVATLGAVGLGLKPDGTYAAHPVDLLLCLIPLTAAYVDLLCSQIALRVQLIAAFMRMEDPDIEKAAGTAQILRLYERFVDSAGKLDWAPDPPTPTRPKGRETWRSRHAGAVKKFLLSLWPRRKDPEPVDILWFGPLAMYGASIVLSALVGLYGVMVLGGPLAQGDSSRGVWFLASAVFGAVAVDLTWNGYCGRLARIKDQTRLPPWPPRGSPTPKSTT